MLDASGPLRRSASSVSAWSKLAALSATLVAATALAEPPATTPQPEQPTAPAPAPTAPPVAGPAANDYISQAMVLDASNDRGLIASHAGVVGDGNWTINSYERIGIGATRGFSDRAQVSVTTLLPIVSGMPLPVLLQGKYVLFQNPATQVSAMVNLSFIRDTVTTFGAGGVESSSSIFVGTFGGSLAVDHYVAEGRLGLHSTLTLNGAFASGDTGASESAFQLGNGSLGGLWGGVSFRATGAVKLIAEAVLPIAYLGGEFQAAEVVMAVYGVRFFGPSLAVDLSFIRPLGKDVLSSSFVLGFPWVAFTYRP